MPHSLTPDQAAELLECSGPHVRRLIVRGELPAIAIGRRYKLDPVAVEAFRESMKVKPKGERADEFSVEPRDEKQGLRNFEAGGAADVLLSASDAVSEAGVLGGTSIAQGLGEEAQANS